MIATKFGQMGFDPMLVPRAASMQLGARDAFAEHFDAAIAASDHGIEGKPAVAATPSQEPTAPKATATTEPEPDAEPAADPAPVREPAATAVDESQAASAAATMQNPVRGESARRIPEAKDADSPLTSPSPAGTWTALADAASQARAATPFAGGQAPTGSPAGTPTRASGDIGRIGSVATAAATAAKAGKATTTTGYRSLNAQAAQLDAQARDSVFRQVLFKLGKERGEMRVQLEPAEFGHLDLHLQVEHDGRVRLSIGAERSDLAALLQQNLEPLKHALQQQGLTVTHAEVHTQQGGTSQQGNDGNAARGDAERATDDDDAAIAPRIGTGFVGARGLDFWA